MQEDSNSREVYNVLKDIEVKEAIENALENIEQPIQVVFRSSKCLDCKQRGDERLFSKYCHMQSIFIHTGISEDCHPGHLEVCTRYTFLTNFNTISKGFCGLCFWRGGL